MFKTFVLKFLFHPQENENHYSNHILGKSSNIPSNPVDEQLATTDSRATPSCAMC